MAKKIAPVQVWVNGESKTAEFLDAYGIQLTLGVSSKFVFFLYSKNIKDDGSEVVGEIVSSGNLEMKGLAYQEWEQDEFAWDWIAEQLNVTIIQ